MAITPFPSDAAQTAYTQGYEDGMNDDPRFFPKPWDRFSTGSVDWWRNYGLWDGHYVLPPKDPALQSTYQARLGDFRKAGMSPPTPPGPPPLVPALPMKTAGYQAAPPPRPPVGTGGTYQAAPPPRPPGSPPPVVVQGTPPPTIAPAAGKPIQVQGPDGHIYTLPPGAALPPGYVAIPEPPWGGAGAGWSPGVMPAPPWSMGWPYASQPSPPWAGSGSGFSFWGPWGGISINQPQQRSPIWTW